jgi:hypothetical protein
MPTAPVPIGRNAAITAVKTARRAIDFVSNLLLLTLAKRRRSAQGRANAKSHWGRACGVEMRKGQRKPSALMALVAMSAGRANPRKENAEGVRFMVTAPTLAQHQRR